MNASVLNCLSTLELRNLQAFEKMAVVPLLTDLDEGLSTLRCRKQWQAAYLLSVKLVLVALFLILESRTQRVFRVSRIRRMEPTSEKFCRHEVNNSCLPWNDAWNSNENGMKVTLRPDRLGCTRASDYFPEKMITPDGHGGFTLVADFPDHEWVADFILGFGDHAVVLEPKSLRDTMSYLARSIQKKYAIEHADRVCASTAD